MNTQLRYFTGTGNSLKILETCRKLILEAGNDAQISEVSLSKNSIPDSDLLGFCFPVYAFGIPRICYRYLKRITKFKKRQKVFILITAGDADESGFAIKECVRLLKRKNCEIIYTDVIEMPVNWTTSPVPPYPPTNEEALEIIKKGELQAKTIVLDIEKGVKKFHRFNYPQRYSKVKFYWDYYMFKYLGLQHMWRLFQVYSSCNGCSLCSKICPTNSIRMVDQVPVWSKTCEQCMRCVNFCPQESIYQLQGGDTKRKNKYREPNFKPKHNN
ncbi:MAG: EFR1 family ferrodoxin [Bacteroidales bacterium]|nr:EFR1 family ferrodoxin [Bacteroidales bacterium]